MSKIGGVPGLGSCSMSISPSENQPPPTGAGCGTLVVGAARRCAIAQVAGAQAPPGAVEHLGNQKLGVLQWRLAG